MTLMVAVVGMVAGCQYEAEKEPAQPTLAPSLAELVAANGTGVNGTGVNGTGVNGTSLGSMLEFVSLSGATQNGIPYDYVELSGSSLVGHQGATTVSGTSFAQSRFTGTTDIGAQVSLRVDAVTTPASGSDVWAYRISYLNSGDGQWYPLCKDANGVAVDAIALSGRWDYRSGVQGGGAKIVDSSVFTFGCQGATLAKCVNFGYKPWATVNGVSLADHHQACVRMVRADYCGDGASHTVNGQWVNLYDAIPIQTDTESWYFEGEWTPNGARCFSQDHNRAHTTVTCSNMQTITSCGDASHFSQGALLMSETPY